VHWNSFPMHYVPISKVYVEEHTYSPTTITKQWKFSSLITNNVLNFL
jgi:hypothetical protein